MSSPPPARRTNIPRPGMPAALRTLSAAFILLVTVPVAIPQSRASEDDVKAAYLFNFGKFVRLTSLRTEPPPPNFDICLISREPDAREKITAALRRISAGERINDHPVRIMHFSHASEARSCAIVFLTNTSDQPIEKELTGLRGSDALTVSDDPKFLDRGGMVQFISQGNRIRFAVNLNAVTGTNIEVSSELLKVASNVTGSQRGVPSR